MTALTFIFLIIAFVHCHASESYCRQFEYDEKMLTKMIKTEIALESMRKELTTVGDEVDRKIESAIKVNDKRFEARSLDGGWTSWSDWSACTMSCGGGIQSRYRSCDNPARYLKGKMCEGPPMEFRACATDPCQPNVAPTQPPKVGFTARGASFIKEDGALGFRKFFSRYGDASNTVTGKFVCEVPGLYLFMATIIASPSTREACYCHIKVGRIAYTLVYAHSKREGDYPSGSARLVYELNTGDEVYLGECSNVEKFDLGTHFSGVLIR